MYPLLNAQGMSSKTHYYKDTQVDVILTVKTTPLEKLTSSSLNPSPLGKPCKEKGLVPFTEGQPR